MAHQPKSPTDNNAFCVHPWIHLRLQSGGEAQVCCRYRTNMAKDGVALTLRRDSFDEIWNSDEMRQVRRDMVEGKQVSGCAECYQEEAGGGVSMRMRDNVAWENGWLNERGATMEALKAAAAATDFRLAYLPANIEVDTGSLCNLKCRMCHDGVSSRIATDVVHRSWATDQYSSAPYHDQQLVVRPPSLRRWSLAKDLEAAITGSPGQVKRVYFIGGEPLLVREVGELLQRLVDTGASRDVVLAVVSNGTVSGSWLEMAGHFKHLDVSISIDGAGRHYEYIRYPAKWEKVSTNISAFRALPNASCGGAVTLQVYNALNITDLFRYFDAIDLPFHAWPVHVPRYLSIDALPPNARRVGAERLRQYADTDCRPHHRDLVRGLADQFRADSGTFDPGLLRDFMLFTNDLDVSRSQSFADANGELVRLFEEAGYPWTSQTVHAKPRTPCNDPVPVWVTQPTDRDGNPVPLAGVERP
jgi:MoaA/NifB/PqqE/SkfB family radical SAM enzyme